MTHATIRLIAAVSTSSVDAYIEALGWSQDATDRDKTLTVGNIRAFASHVLFRLRCEGCTK